MNYTNNCCQLTQLIGTRCRRHNPTNNNGQQTESMMCTWLLDIWISGKNVWSGKFLNFQNDRNQINSRPTAVAVAATAAIDVFTFWKQCRRAVIKSAIKFEVVKPPKQNKAEKEKKKELVFATATATCSYIVTTRLNLLLLNRNITLFQR